MDTIKDLFVQCGYGEENGGLDVLLVLSAPFALFVLLVIVLLGRRRNRERRAMESLRVHHLASRGRLHSRPEPLDPPHTPERW